MSSRKTKQTKGFPVKLSTNAWQRIEQCYRWLRSIDGNTIEMDAAFEMIPKVKINKEDIDYAMRTGESKTMLGHRSCQGTHYNNTTVRFRGISINGAVQLLRVASAYMSPGPSANTARRRADRLESIGLLDRIVDHV